LLLVTRGCRFFYKYIEKTYNRELRAATRHYISTAQKIANQKQQLTFNHRCKYYGLLPPSLRVRPLVNTNTGRKIARRASDQFLHARISENATSIRHLETDLFFQKRQLEFALRPEHADALQQLKDRSSSQLTEKIKTRLKRKFNWFLQRRTGTSPTHHAIDKWVTNLSSRQLSPAETSVLSKGLNFAPTPRTVPVPQIVAAVEDGLRRLRTDLGKIEDARNSIVGILQRARPPPSNLTPDECKALSTLRQDDSIVIIPADKGRSTVILNKPDYDQKIKAHSSPFSSAANRYIKHLHYILPDRS